MPSQDETQEFVAPCHNCSERMTSDDVVTDDLGNEMCQECYDENYLSADCCGCELHNESVLYTPGGDEAYCEDCYHDNITYCEECSEDYWNDDMQYSESDGEYYCEDCYLSNHSNANYEWNVYSNNFIKENTDFATPEKCGYSSDTFSLIKSKRYQGIEIETNYAGDWTNSFVYDQISRKLASGRGNGHTMFNVVYDGSVNGGDDSYGGEVVVSPRRGDVLYKDMLTITDTLKKSVDAYISRKCGYHLHIDTRDYDWQHFLMLVIMTKMIEPHIYSWLPSSRRTSNWCKPVSQSFDELRYICDRDSFLEYYYDDCGFSNNKYNEKRYHGLNLHSHFQANQGVELRYHSGTLNADKMLHWSIFWSQVVDKCYDLGTQLADEMRERNIHDLYDTSLFKSLLTKNVIKYEKDKLLDISDRIHIHDGAYTNISQYKKDSKYLSDLLGIKSDKVYLIEPMLRFVRQNKYTKATMTIDSLFDTFEIPILTQEFYRERLVEIMDNPNTPTRHVIDCFNNSDFFVDFDKDNMSFKLAGIMSSMFPTIDDDVVKDNQYGSSNLAYISKDKMPSDIDGFVLNPVGYSSL
jgi:hypothetical protein